MQHSESDYLQLISELTTAKEMLGASERKYRLIAENTLDGIITNCLPSLPTKH